MIIRDLGRSAKTCAIALCAVAVGTEAHAEGQPQAAGAALGMLIGLLGLGTAALVSIVRRMRLARARARAPVVRGGSR